MFEIGMYVRCPMGQFEDPRSFICGKIEEIDEFSETYTVVFEDPFAFKNYYAHIPEESTYAFQHVKRCKLFKGTLVIYNYRKYKIISVEKEDEWYFYYIQDDLQKKLIKVREDKVAAPFNAGQISPVEQLANYEFQNPVWYLGRNVVSKTVNILDNSVFGFEELAGCKIFLMPHQLKTIIRCLQSDTCRYMLADEVGMGKTIEAASILKIYLTANTNKRVLVAVPRPLLKQWKT